MAGHQILSAVCRTLMRVVCRFGVVYTGLGPALPYQAVPARCALTRDEQLWQLELLEQDSMPDFE